MLTDEYAVHRKGCSKRRKAKKKGTLRKEEDVEPSYAMEVVFRRHKAYRGRLEMTVE